MLTAALWSALSRYPQDRHSKSAWVLRLSGCLNPTAGFYTPEDKVGALEAGHYGDLIAVDGDPLADITELERVKLVIKGAGLELKAAG